MWEIRSENMKMIAEKESYDMHFYGNLDLV
ncbi:hypothetical protein SUSAZ_09325 [Sulfolobus acidocaldarius SUSAZ]|nr:hypothetical protein SUSAZ_09325 [Sulfolobus acidocaldarius SUSAZ]